MTQRSLSISSPDEHTGEAPEPSREKLAVDVLADEEAGRQESNLRSEDSTAGETLLRTASFNHLDTPQLDLATAQGLSHEQGDNPGKPVGSFLLDWLCRYNAQLGLGSGTAAGFGLHAGSARCGHVNAPIGAGSDLHQNRNALTPRAIGDKSP
jgi:hypothetical protein